MTPEECIKMLERMMNKVGPEGVRLMRETITENGSVRSGVMLRSVNSKRSGFIVTISTGTNYAIYVEDGRRGFGPKNKKALHWFDPYQGYGEVFAKHVGPAPAKHFAEPTAEKIAEFIENFQ